MGFGGNLQRMSLPSLANAPAMLLDQPRHQLLERLTEGLDAAALNWLSGYAAGLAAQLSPHGGASTATSTTSTTFAPTAERVEHAQRATILFASQTGNGRRLAERLARNLESQGIAARAVATADYATRELAQERLLYVIASTHGDGDPPDDARACNDYLFSRRAPRLDRLSFSVLALGDSSYPKFCEIGRRFDAQFAALGGRRLGACVECDVDYEKAAAAWLQTAAESARSELHAPRLAIVTTLRTPSALATREQPFEAELLVAQQVTARGAEKRVTHLELAAPAQRLNYEPGDAVGIWHDNPPECVARVAQLLNLNLDERIGFEGRERTLGQWLTREREITRLIRPFVATQALRAQNAELNALLLAENAAALRAVLKDWQLADLLKRYPSHWTADALVAALPVLTPRLYSIASSRREVGDELHLTVAAIDYRFSDEPRYGAASRYLNALVPGSLLRAYIEPNQRFRVPSDDQRNVIMIGPGTGVAPFRGFVQERVARGASGQNWLFFGGRHLQSDFLYQAEWLDAQRRGQLQRLDVAFSRDQQQKIYVQDRLREHGADVYRWLADGAYLYVCGDAARMAPDVHAALRDVVATHGDRSPEAAEAYLAELATERRYLRDVY